MISICISDMSFALFLIALCQPGMCFDIQDYDQIFPMFSFLLGFNEGRYADFVNESSQRCKWSQVIGTFLMTAPWYNFLGNFGIKQKQKTLYLSLKGWMRSGCMPSRDQLISGFHSKDTGNTRSSLLWRRLSSFPSDSLKKSSFVRVWLFIPQCPFDHFYLFLRWSRVILVCWALALLPAIPLMFNSTVERNWEGKSNCKCFLPIDDVSI